MRWLAKLSLALAGPAIAHFIYVKITLTEASLASLVIVGLFGLYELTDYILASREEKKQARLTMQEVWVRIGDLITSIKSSATPKTSVDDTINATLGIIEGVARQITNCKKGEISVSLTLYKGSSRNKMHVRHRNPGSERPIGRTINDLSNLLGHHVCEFGKGPQIVADLSSFGKDISKSPTQKKTSYRSIAIFPLEAMSNNKNIGFLSVDCSKPHAFHGDRARDLAVTCEPLISHIQDLY